MVIRLLQNDQRRYIASETDLLVVVCESLDRLAQKLQAPPMGTSLLWNYEGSGNMRRNFRPKDEEDLSDYIAGWLGDDLGPARGVVVNREVQPRRGQKTDIWVSAAPQSRGAQASDILRVVVEVKGCWNEELWTAMEAQLADRYLLSNALSCGVYLIGWFRCESWSEDDGRKRRTPNLDLSAVHARLMEQAKQLRTRHSGLDVRPHVVDIAIRLN